MAELIAGRNTVIEALKAGRTVNKIILSKGTREGSVREIIGMAKERGIPYQELERHLLDKMTPERHQGVIAEVAPFNYVEVSDILAKAQEKGEPPFLVILAELEDPHNFGAIIRTSESVGVHGIIIPRHRGVQVTAAVGKVSAGAVEYVPVARVTNLVRTVEELQKAGLWIAAADMDGNKDLWRTNLTGPLAVVIGGEGKGIPRLLKEKCDFLTRIPMKGQIGSLNASVAASILLFEVMRQRLEV